MRDWHLTISKIVVLTFLLFFTYMTWEMNNELVTFISYSKEVNDLYKKEIKAKLGNSNETNLSDIEKITNDNLGKITLSDIEKITNDNLGKISQIAKKNFKGKQNKNLFLVVLLEKIEFSVFGTTNTNRPVIVFFFSILLSSIIILLSQIRLKKMIIGPPFSVIREIADLLPKKQREILNQEVLDAEEECLEAISEKKIWRARIIRLFYYTGISWSVVMWIADKVKKVIGIIPKAG